jgi:hypothetical protein
MIASTKSFSSTYGARSGVVEAAHDAGLGEGLVVFDEDQIHHQLDHFTRRDRLDVGAQVFADVVLIAHQPLYAKG